MNKLLLSLLLAPPGQAIAQTTIVGDAWISGQMGIGTTNPSARFEVLPTSTATTVFQISGVDGTPFLTIGSSGAVGVGLTPSANLDVNGSADSSSIGLRLRNGNLYPANSAYQIAFGYNGSANLRHAIRSVHISSTANNSIDFLLWNTAVATTAVGSLQVASLVTIPSTGAAVHLMPFGTPDVQLEVSNGASTGGGIVERAAEGVHSSRELKTDIAYLGSTEEAQAFQDVVALKHAVFRYKRLAKGRLSRDSQQPLVRGLIYEDSPDSIRGTGKAVIIDERVTNAEMALKEMMRHLEAMEGEAAALR